MNDSKTILVARRRWMARLVVGSLGPAMLLSHSLRAQESSPPSPSGLEEITVTAEFRRENLQDTPIAITAITAQSLEARGQTNLVQLAAQAPNVDIQPAAQGYGPAAVVSIRGIGQRDSSFAFEPGVGVYIDDVYFSTVLGNTLDLLDLDRVEILRGPQGTLAGKNSIGGALKLFSKQPSDDPDAFLQATYGSYKLTSARGATNFTVVPNTLFLRVSAAAKHIDGYLNRFDYKCTHPSSALPTYASGPDCLLGTEGGTDDTALRATLRWIASDQLSVSLIGDFSHSNTEPTPNALIIARPSPAQLPAPINGVNFGPEFQSPNPYTNYATYAAPTAGWQPRPNTLLTSWGTSLTADYTIAESLSLKYIGSLRRLSSTYTQDTDASPFDDGLTYNPQSQRQVTQEVRLNATVRNIDFTLGGFYYDGRGTSTGRIHVGSFLDELLNDLIDSKNKSGFLHGVWHATDALDITAGARYSDESKSYLFRRSTIDGSFSPFVNPLNGLIGVAGDRRADYRAALDYRWSNSLFTYVQFSTGFKGGGINPRPYYQNQVAPFGPETLDAYEIGLKSDLLNRKLRLNLAAFYNKYKSIQIQTLTPYFNPALPVQPDPALPLWNPAEGTFPSGVYKNAGDADVKGAEGELTLAAVEHLSIEASISYLDFKYTNLTAESIASGITPGMVTPFSPKWKGSLALQYEMSLAGAGWLTPRLDYSGQSRTFSDPLNGPTNELQAYGLLNGRLTYDSPARNWQASVAVTNITDKFYWQNKFDFFSIQGFTTGVPSRPREWLVSLKHNF